MNQIIKANEQPKTLEGVEAFWYGGKRPIFEIKKIDEKNNVLFHYKFYASGRVEGIDDVIVYNHVPRLIAMLEKFIPGHDLDRAQP